MVIERSFFILLVVFSLNLIVSIIAFGPERH